MVLTRLLILSVGVAAVAVADRITHHKRDAEISICRTIYSNESKVQCDCVYDRNTPNVIKSADCFLTTSNIDEGDIQWASFDSLKTAGKLVFTTTRGIKLTYIPTSAIKKMKTAQRIDIKHGDVKEIKPYAFGNLTEIEEISLSGNEIQVLHKNAFAHLISLKKLNLDSNNIVEINRDVFKDLPSLNQLYLASNKITTIHDKAFAHLVNLKELEIDRNKIFSLNSESFAGLRNLQRLELSSNSIQVIGDNTFLPLTNLLSLNLEENKIQMIDEKAFNGLSHLQSLSLATNKLHEIENVNVFRQLHSLISLDLRKNKLTELKVAVMEPLMTNFYSASGSLGFDDNEFPCDCRLDWFLSLKNKTANENLKLSIENLKCIPDAQLSESWKKLQEIDKNSGAVFEDEEPQAQNTDYEYYDESQLGGKLFYVDIRDLLNCTQHHGVFTESPMSTLFLKSTHQLTEARTTAKSTPTPETTSTVSISDPSDLTSSTSRPITVPSHRTTKITNRGLLDLSLDEATAKEAEMTTRPVKKLRSDMQNDGKKNVYTTSRLATVSAKPIEKKSYVEKEMASDEAAPELKAHRSVQEIGDENVDSNGKPNRAAMNHICLVTLIPILLVFRILD